MRELAAIALLVTAGCGFSARLGDSAAGGDDAVEVDARVVDGPSDDVDADGVKNDADNCPSVANAGQFDEDEDLKGDECDPCPQLGTTVADADGDGDGIGDGCDPRPAAGGDVLAYWNGFHVDGAGLPAGMTMIHGSATRWSVAGGYLVFARSGSDWGMPVVDAGGPAHAVDARFEITASYLATTASAAGVAVDVAADDTFLFECQARTDNDAREMWRRNPSANDGWSFVTGTSATTPNDTYRITLQRTLTDLACVTTRQDQVSVPLSNDTDSSQNTRAGLFARNVDARFHYLAVYRSP